MRIWLLSLTVICAAVALTSFMLYLFVPAKKEVTGTGTPTDFTTWPVTYQWPPRTGSTDTLGDLGALPTNMEFATYKDDCDSRRKFLRRIGDSTTLSLPATDSAWVIVLYYTNIIFPHNDYGTTGNSTSAIFNGTDECVLLYVDITQWGAWILRQDSPNLIQERPYTQVKPVDVNWNKTELKLDLFGTNSIVHGMIRYPAANVPTSTPARIVEGALWSLFADLTTSPLPSPTPLWKTMPLETLSGTECFNDTNGGTYPLYSFSGSFSVVKPFDQSVALDKATPLGLHVLVQKRSANELTLPLRAHAVRVIDVTLRYPAMTELVVGQRYTFIPTNAASLAFLPNKVRITAGSLPAGLSLTGEGHITGSPTTAGTGSFTASLVDDPTYTDTVSFKVTAAPIPLTPATTPTSPVPLTSTPTTTVTTTTDANGQVTQIAEETGRTTETKRPLFLWLGVGLGAAAAGGAAWLTKEAVAK